jgi:STE24 endopeptidase
LLIAFGFAFVSWSFDRVNKDSWGVRGVSDVAGLPLLVALLSVYFFVMTPAVNGLIRIHEVESDLFGLNASRQPDGFAEAIMGLSEYRKLKPGYWEEILFFDHPSGYNRIHMAMQWKKENLKAPAQ